MRTFKVILIHKKSARVVRIHRQADSRYELWRQLQNDEHYFLSALEGEEPTDEAIAQWEQEHIAAQRQTEEAVSSRRAERQAREIARLAEARAKAGLKAF